MNFDWTEPKSYVEVVKVILLLVVALGVIDSDTAAWLEADITEIILQVGAAIGVIVAFLKRSSE